MKKILLLLTTITCFAVTGLSQCTTPISPYVFANQSRLNCSNVSVDLQIITNGGGLTPTFELYDANTQQKLQPFEYFLSPTIPNQPFYNLRIFALTPNISLRMVKIEMTSSDPCASPKKVNSLIFIDRLQPLSINYLNVYSKAICATPSYTLTTTPNKSMDGYIHSRYPGYVYSEFQWYKNQVLIPNATDSIYIATSSGSYTMQCGLSENNNPVMSCISNSLNLTFVDCTPFSTKILGDKIISLGQKNTAYNVINQSGFSYNWYVTGGYIVSGQNTNSVLVNWDATTSPHSIFVIENNQGSDMKTTSMDVSTLTTGISSSLSQAGIVLFPNPATDAFYIEMPQSGLNVAYDIVDVRGLSVASGNFISSSSGEKIETTFGPGIYQVVLHYNNGVTTGRLSKVQ